MRLTIRKDGFGYSDKGFKYWRDEDGCWLRVVPSSSWMSATNMGWGTASGAITRMMVRYKGENVVHEVGA